MSHTRHGWAAVIGSVAAITLLSGCFGSGSQEPTAVHRTKHHSKATEATSPTAPTSSPTGSSSPSAGSAVLSFSPRSGGKHNDDCQRLQPGDDPAEFLYYPVLVKAPTTVTVETVTTDHTQGVVDAAAWVAPAGTTPETGTFKGWPPPKIVTGDPNLQWSKRVPAKGATLQPGVFYNVFLRLQVDPTPGDSEVNGLQLTYDADGASPGSSVEWIAHTTFSMSC
jgi:hypothetical protein